MPESAHSIPLKDLPGFELTLTEQFDLGDDYTVKRSSRGTNTSGDYIILSSGNDVGCLSLTFGLRNKVVSFDISIHENGKNHGIRSLQALAVALHNTGFSLETGGIMADSRGYWEKMHQQGYVEPIDIENPSRTQYRVIPNKL